MMIMIWDYDRSLWSLDGAREGSRRAKKGMMTQLMVHTYAHTHIQFL